MQLIAGLAAVLVQEMEVQKQAEEVGEEVVVEVVQELF